MGYQLPLFPNQDKIINVASVPLRSPFRYPGGKTWLVPRIRQWLINRRLYPAKFIEPFAGGGIVGLTVAFDRLADHIILVELDEQIAAVWQTMLKGNGEWLANQIVKFELTPEAVETELAKEGLSLEERAFQTILKNRVNHGGILASGAGRIKNGEKNKGLHSRWYPDTLAKRIRDIITVRDRITFIEGDGVEVIRQSMSCSDTVYFIDPPYTAGGKNAGSRLYTHSELNHDALFDVASQAQGDFLMSYSNDELVKELARKYRLAVREVPMKNTHHSRMTELLIGRDLDWL